MMCESEAGDLIADYEGYLYIMLCAGEFNDMFTLMGDMRAGHGCYDGICDDSSVTGMLLLPCNGDPVTSLGIRGWRLRKLS